MTAQAQRHEEINQDFQDEEEGRKGGGAKDEAVAAIPPTPKRNHVQKVCLRFKVLQSATRMKHPISRSVWEPNSHVKRTFQHNRTPSVTSPVDFATIERRKKQKADYEQVIRKQQDESGGGDISGFKIASANKEDNAVPAIVDDGSAAARYESRKLRCR
jgi:hypothetical protein